MNWYEIHTYKDKKIYGQSYQDVNEVLTIIEDKEDNILEDLNQPKK
ncbi:MAG: hypothetical protein ACO1OC_06300 [Tuberibacillus sp.]